MPKAQVKVRFNQASNLLREQVSILGVTHLKYSCHTFKLSPPPPQQIFFTLKKKIFFW